MYSQSRYAPLYVHEHRHLDLTSCLLFLTGVVLLAIYVILPGISLPFALISITAITALGIISGTVSLTFEKFWLLKIYATCGLIGNTGVLLWLLLSV